MLMIEASMPAASDAQAAFIGKVMAALPSTPTNGDVDGAIKAILAAPAPASNMFGNASPASVPRRRVSLKEPDGVETANQR
jgi:hypothetical protein